MEKGSLQIHSENILPIIKKWLYSDKDIFVRELISNACDAIQKVKILRDQGLVKAYDDEFRINVQVNKEARTLTFSDNGIGMDAEEVKKYIAQIAFSGAEEFLSKYKSNDEKDQMIGHFGLGFFSAYMVADKVEVDTLSYREGAEPVVWICDGSSSYEMDRGTRTTRGTTITLFIGKDHDESLDQAHINQILRRYCRFLPYPILIDDKPINEIEPLWIKPPSACSDEDYLNFYRTLYPLEEDPLFWIHLNVDYPFNLKGILYFPKMKREFDMNKSYVDLYCNRVFVSDNCRDLLPNYLTMLKGIIDSPDIPLNVSRSYLQMDRTVRQLATHISKKVSDSLVNLYRTDRERFIRAWQDVGLIVKLGIAEDQKFYERVKECLIWQNTAHAWTTLDEYLEKNRTKTDNKILYTTDERHAGHILDIYHQQDIEVLCTNGPLDAYIIQVLEEKLRPVTFQRIDSEVHNPLVDKTREKTILDAEGKTEASKLADFIRSKLDNDKIAVEAKSLATDSLYGLILIDEKQRRMRDYFMRLEPQEREKQMQWLDKKTFVVNTNNGLMNKLQKIDRSQPEVVREVVKDIYELTLLAQREMEPSQLNEFIDRNHRLLEVLADQILKTNE